MYSSSTAPDWLGEQSTMGEFVLVNLPILPADGDLLLLPSAPTTSEQAIALIQWLRNSGLPTSENYNSTNSKFRQNRLVHALFKLLLQALNVWASDPANADAATVIFSDDEIFRRHQLSPFCICYRGRVPRNDAFTSTGLNLMPEEGRIRKSVFGTFTECAGGYRPISGNMFLVSLEVPSSFSSWSNRESDGVVDPLEDKYNHDVAVYITPGASDIYIYDPMYEPSEWSEVMKFSRAPKLERVRELLAHIKQKHYSPLCHATIRLGGGGIVAERCREMAVDWIVRVIAQQWMRLDGPELAEGPPMYFEPGRTPQQKLMHF